MPSAKPDKQEIATLRRRRGLWHDSPTTDLYSELHQQCLSAVEGGFITPDRARSLWAFLQAEVEIAAIYPNNALLQILRRVCEEEGWSSQAEGDLLHCIFSLYLGYESADVSAKSIGVSISFNEENSTVSVTESSELKCRPPSDIAYFLSDIKTRESNRLRCLYDLMFDNRPSSISLTDRFVGFTGSFSYGSRAACFSEVRQRGGVPCDPVIYLDFLFVSRIHEEQKAISGQLSSAIYYRRLYGTPKVLREVDWEALLIGG